MTLYVKFTDFRLCATPPILAHAQHSKGSSLHGRSIVAEGDKQLATFGFVNDKGIPDKFGAESKQGADSRFWFRLPMGEINKEK